MGRFDSIVEQEGKKKENPFVKSNSTLVGAKVANKIPDLEKQETEEVLRKEKEPQKETPQSEVKETAPAEKKTAKTTQKKAFNLDDMFPETAKSKGRTRSLFIKDDIYSKLELFAEKKGTSVSKVVNEILSTVFEDD